MGAGQSVNSTAEVAKLQNENKKLKEQLETLQASQPGGKKRMTMAVRESTTETKFQRPDRRGEISAEVRKGGQWTKKDIPKDASVEAAITKNVCGSVLFQKLGIAEQKDCVGAFYPQEVEAGTEVIKQNEKGNIYFFVESGQLDVLVNVEGSGPIKMQEVKEGDGFGELALLYNTPRAATVKATSAAKLWCLERSTYNAIIQHYKRQQAERYVEYLKNVSCKATAGDTDLNLKNLSPAELQQLAEAMEDETFNKGDVIIRQGEKGDDFYIIATGSVSVLVDGKDVATKNSGDYFGEQALLSEDTRTATCSAKEDNTMLLSINREHFVELLGALSELIDRKQTDATDMSLKGTDDHGTTRAILFEDLDIKATLGCGAFGRVKLVTDKKTGSTYALKCQSKAEIVENSLQVQYSIHYTQYTIHSLYPHYAGPRAGRAECDAGRGPPVHPQAAQLLQGRPVHLLPPRARAGGGALHLPAQGRPLQREGGQVLRSGGAACVRAAALEAHRVPRPQAGESHPRRQGLPQGVRLRTSEGGHGQDLDPLR
jgi:CRP-like cAMP-binding protein